MKDWNVLRRLYWWFFKALVAGLFLLPREAFGQDVGTQVGLPVDRYSISPYLQDPFLFIQGTSLPDLIKLDVSLGLKYMRQPWRLEVDAQPDLSQSPVDDHLQFRPGVSFGYRRWMDVAVVLPISYQTTGGGTELAPASGQDGLHLLDPELLVRLPIFRERGFGLAFAGQVFVPVGAKEMFVGSKTWQGAVALVALDWRFREFAVALNTGAHLREHGDSELDTRIEPEWLIRPGVSYLVPVGSYSIGISAEANIATSLYHFFARENVDAFQLLLSVQIQPISGSDGFYGAAGGGSAALGEIGGYSVPLAHFDGRFGYSFQWDGKRELEELPAAKTAPVGEEKEPVVEKVPAELMPTKVPAELPEKEKRGEPPLAAGAPSGGRVLASRAGFPFNLPRPVTPDKPYSYVDLPESPSLSPSYRAEVIAKVTENLDKIRAPGASLLIVGFADKCFEGSADVADLFNLELSQRRANVVVDLLKRELGEELRGVPIRTQAMGRKCASADCVCSAPQGTICARDRKVEVFIESGESEEFICPEGSK